MQEHQLIKVRIITKKLIRSKLLTDHKYNYNSSTKFYVDINDDVYINHLYDVILCSIYIVIILCIHLLRAVRSTVVK